LATSLTVSPDDPSGEAGQQTGALSGTVSAADGGRLAGVVVRVDGGLQTTADVRGDWQLDGLEPGRVTVAFEAPDRRYAPVTIEATVEADTVVRVDARLHPLRLPVEVVAGDSRVTTAVAASRRAFPDGAEWVVVAAAGAFPDALAAAPLAGRLGGPLLLADRRAGPALLGEAARLGAARAVIVGAVGAVTATVQAELEQAGVTVERIAGDGRFDTAALVARKVGVGTDREGSVASGAGFADAMAAGPLAAAWRIPILLTDPRRLPDDTAAVLGAIGAARSIVCGGPAAVSDAVAERLPAPRRVAGPDRYATSVALAELLVERGGTLGTVSVATGQSFADGLAAGPATARDGGPLLLVHGQDPSQGSATYAFLDRRLPEIGVVVAYGGDAAIAAAVRARLAEPYGALGGSDR
jgi:putative cell wall-binding protein